MSSRYVRVFIAILLLIVLASSEDLIWPSSDDFWVPDSGLPIDQFAGSSELPASPFDQKASLFELSGLPESSESSLGFDTPPLFDDMNSDILPFSSGLDEDSFFDTAVSDDPLQLVDCSAADDFPVVARPRVKRQNGSAACDNPAAGSSISPDGAVGNFLNQASEGLGDSSIEKFVKKQPYYDFAMQKIKEDSQRNLLCLVLSRGVLPWGVCSSFEAQDLTSVGQRLFTGDSFQLPFWNLRRAILSKLVEKSIRANSIILGENVSINTDFDSKFDLASQMEPMCRVIYYGPGVPQGLNSALPGQVLYCCRDIEPMVSPEVIGIDCVSATYLIGISFGF